MGKPRLIILIRHAQSEGNKNREIHQTIPDHRVKLTAEGQRQALEAGRKLRSLLRPDDTLHFFTSPYRRTRETTEGILQSLTSDDPSPSPFPRHTIKVYEEPRLREQDFGNFQPSSTEMSRMWHERAEYGHFFYRIPNGESAADAYDRISGFNESLWRSFKEDDFASVCVLVTHGLMTRVFLMKWYHWSVEYFEDLRNVNHCEFIVMAQNPANEKFVLKNQLRTWTQFKREQEEAQAERQRRLSEAADVNSPQQQIPLRKKWGTAHDHDPHLDYRPPRRQNTADLFRPDDAFEQFASEAAAAQVVGFGGNLKRTPSSAHKEAMAQAHNEPDIPEAEEDPDTPTQETLPTPSSTSRSRGGSGASSNGKLATYASPRPPPINTAAPAATGGSRSASFSRGTYTPATPSGTADTDDTSNLNSTLQQNLTLTPNSRVEKGAFASEEERQKQFRPPRSMALALSGRLDGNGKDEEEEWRKGAMADALGDQSDMDESEDEEVRRVKDLEGGWEGSVR